MNVFLIRAKTEEFVKIWSILTNALVHQATQETIVNVT